MTFCLPEWHSSVRCLRIGVVTVWTHYILKTICTCKMQTKCNTSESGVEGFLILFKTLWTPWILMIDQWLFVSFRSTEASPEPASILVGHAETLLPLLSLLGLYKDQTPPTANNFHTQHGTKPLPRPNVQWGHTVTLYPTWLLQLQITSTKPTWTEVMTSLIITLTCSC